uniref:hypothetical protein n=1 Tax=Inonotus hispidus TaxID=40469 RepID=UPI002182290C|nr:hypothetical protein N4M07_mgp056 [Inonotus hispidus]UVF37996.1 hypothetical protein [Inonotus hispidus]
MNSLYGRMGMKPKMLSHTLVNNSDVSTFISKIGLENLANQIELGNKTILSYWLDFSNVPKINVSIASAITANARVYMTEFKNNPLFKLYYSETESVFFNKPLPGHLVDSKKVGMFNLERVLTKFVALGPKVYGGIEINGNEFTKV